MSISWKVSLERLYCPGGINAPPGQYYDRKKAKKVSARRCFVRVPEGAAGLPRIRGMPTCYETRLVSPALKVCVKRVAGNTYPESFAENPITSCKRAAELFRPLPDRLRKVSRLVCEPGRLTIVVHLFLVIPAPEERLMLTSFCREEGLQRS